MRYTFIIFFLPWIILSLFTGKGMAQKAAMEITPEEIRPGEHAAITLYLTIPSEGYLLAPGLADVLGEELELIRTLAADTLERTSDSLSIRKEFIITAWEDGYFPIKPISYKHISNQDTILFESRPALLQVTAVEVDLEEGYKEIRPIIQVSRGFWEVFVWILAGLVLAVVVFVIYKRVRKSDDRDIPEPVRPVREDVPAHIAAISSLETLRRKQLWKEGKIKQHHIELTDILRLYISRRFGIAAQEMTTEEILVVLPSKLNHGTASDLIAGILREADMVKFAKYRPDDDDHEAAVEKALGFVSSTVPEKVEKKNNSNT